MNMKIMTEFGICALSVISVRKEPSDKSEITTQLLFGDLLEELDRLRGWSLIRAGYDGYEGWVDSNQLTRISPEDHRVLSETELLVNRSFPLKVDAGGLPLILSAGCSFYPSRENYTLGTGLGVTPEGSLHPFHFDGTDALIASAKSFLHCPYLWGGKTFMGFDCSGFTQVVFKLHGVKLLRDAAQQASQGENIGFISDSRPGDLAFFDHNDGKVSHVGLLIDEHTIIHCSGSVRIDPVDHHGIFHSEKKEYTHNLRLIRRVIPQ